MIYDENKHYDLVFNEIQKPGHLSGYSFEYARRASEQATTAANGRVIVKVNNLLEFGIGVLVLILSLILGYVLHIFLPCGQSIIFHMAAASMCAYIGLITITSTKNFASHTYYRDRLTGKLTGGLLLIEAVLIPVMWFNLTFETDWECNYFMAGVFFVVIGIYNAISLLMFLTRRLRIYTRKIDAECIGYVRYLSSATPGENTGNHWFHSPVFEYYLDGQKITAFCDSLIRGINAKIPLGPCTINVNKDDPGSVMNPSLGGMITKIIIAAIMLWLGISLIRGVLSGGVQGTSIMF